MNYKPSVQTQDIAVLPDFQLLEFFRKNKFLSPLLCNKFDLRLFLGSPELLNIVYGKLYIWIKIKRSTGLKWLFLKNWSNGHVYLQSGVILQRRGRKEEGSGVFFNLL